jgi:two-component system chemotaxis sensor kinase CheA
MYIDDPELREIYKSSSAERLQNLETILVNLEQTPGDHQQVLNFLREAHTLKGDARMLGLTDIETLAHQMEECLTPIKNQQGVLSSDLCDRLYQGLDVIGQLVQEAVTGKASSVNMFQVLANLMTVDSCQSPKIIVPTPKPSLETDNSSILEDMFPTNDQLFAEDILFPELDQIYDLGQNIYAVSTLESEEADLLFPDTNIWEELSTVSDELTTLINSSPVINPPVQDSHHIDTIRVEAQKLDHLMAQSNEIRTLTGRLSQKVGDIDRLIQLWELLNSEDRQFKTFLASLPADHCAIKIHEQQQSYLSQINDLLVSLRGIHGDSSELTMAATELNNKIEGLRLLPFSTIFQLFPRMVRDLAKEQGKEINFLIEGGDTTVDKRVLEEIKDPLTHLLRNAVDHGIETPLERQQRGKPAIATIKLRAYHYGNRIAIELTDDGQGLDLETIKYKAVEKGVINYARLENMTESEIQSLIFSPGFSTRDTVTDLSGRGVGLDIVRNKVEQLKGAIALTSKFGEGSTFRIEFSNSLNTSQVVILELEENPYAIPVEYIDRLLFVHPDELTMVNGQQTLNVNGEAIPITWLADKLGLSIPLPTTTHSIGDRSKIKLPCIILRSQQQKLALLVSKICDQQEIIIKPLNKLLKNIPYINGSSVLINGDVCLALDPLSLFPDFDSESTITQPTNQIILPPKPSLLLVEDSLVIRTQMKRILESGGYQVTVAVDGLDGWHKLQENEYHAVISDVEMPHLSGVELTRKIRQLPTYRNLPIVLVTTLNSPEDRSNGLSAGANAYVTKGDFDQTSLLKIIEDLITC